MNFWDERFSSEEYVYGKEPNEFFRAVIDNLEPGKILIPGEGEGRNAAYAAGLGWDVHAFDSSEEGKKKALQLAQEKGVEINYTISDYQSFTGAEQFDAIALIFTHLPSSERQEVHRKYASLLKDGGTLIMQVFDKEQLGLNSGGPKSLDLLFSVEDLKEDFEDFSALSIEKEFARLSEGPFHEGEAHLITLRGIK